MIALVTVGPLGLLSGLFLGLFSLGYALLLMAPPAMLLGGLLWARRVRSAAIWAAVGTIGALGCYALAFVLPGGIGEATMFFQPNPVQFAPAFAIAGALAALLFRALMRAFAPYDEALEAA